MIDGEISQTRAKQSLERDIVSINYGRWDSAILFMYDYSNNREP